MKYENAMKNDVRNVKHNGVDPASLGKQPKVKRIRRAKMNKRVSKELKILYSNVRGFTGKKTSIQEIIESVNCDVCLLAETMTINVKIDGMKCVTSKKSVRQNVAIILRGAVAGVVPMKLYEPNETINMIGIRLEVAKNNYTRFYTAHMKQMSTNSREDVLNQFEEIKLQFQQAELSKEGMILICDANVHIGEAIPGCTDKQDWGGAELIKLVDSEGLHLLNREDVCHGVVTRVDPRNGTKSTLDLAICNEFMIRQVSGMVIDEKEEYKPTKYAKKITKTDHNSIIVDLKVKKISNQKSEPYYNTRCEAGQAMFKEEMQNAELDDLFVNVDEMNADYRTLMEVWNNALSKSFKKVRASKNRQSGVDDKTKKLIQEERIVKKEWKEGKEKDTKLEEIRNEISSNIATNIEQSMEEKLQNISSAKYPQAEVFKIRRNATKTPNLDFPLKDMNGNTRVTKEGIDEVITSHFGKVFSQNPVPDGWEEYWKYIVDIYEIISKNEKESIVVGPTFEEINRIIDELDKSKAVYGSMSIELLKIGGVSLRKLIHRCVYLCFISSEIPSEFRIEKMILLYKHKGRLDDLDNYRGIFLRLIILTIYQKWLYSKSSPIADQNGSNSAFGGRKGKSTMSPLLIIKLIQDHAVWTKEQLIFKFMDVEKFFDSMNFHKCMVDLYASGVGGRYWKAYENINKNMVCVPVIPSGPCTEIEVQNVFVQGSSDAVLMAWNHMDTLNKKKRSIWSKRCSIQGVDLDALTYVDDIFEVVKSQYDLLLSSARSEVFQKETRLNFKPPKCKIMVMNQTEQIEDDIGGKILEQVVDHEYLGTMISNDGTRNKEIERRISDARSVSNEIVQVLKTTELSRVRLKYVGMLSNACLDAKVKYGCGVWNELNTRQEKDLNDLKVKVMKRVLELPYSTPSSGVKYEFGLMDLDLDCKMEKIILAYDTLKTDGIVKELLSIMMKNKVPGFCLEVLEALKVMGLDEDSEELHREGKHLRQFLKMKIVGIQRERLVGQMITESKSDRLLLHNFRFDGKMQNYLIELPFEEARVVFMLRVRMFPTKDNFKGRWGSDECTYCGCLESDVHLFSCAGYNDLLGCVSFDMFMTLNASIDELSVGAKQLLKVVDRLALFNGGEN